MFGVTDVRIIAGRWRGHPIQAPPGRNTRPTTDRVREAWMSALQTEVPGARVLDLFAGSGALGLEALSRGAEHVTFVEKSAGTLRVLQANIAKLRAEPVEVVRGDAIAYVRKLDAGAFDVAVADPPYGDDHASALAKVFLQTPFAESLWIEHRVGDSLPELPAETRQRRYGDTMLTTLTAPR